MAGSAIGTVPPTNWLPSQFTTTHNTDGLAGFGALDWFRPGGEPVGLPVGGVVERVSGRGGQNYSGSVYGRSLWVRTDTGQRLFLTHFADPVFVRPGQRIQAGQPLGRVAPWRSGAPHIHVGVQGAKDSGGKVDLGRATGTGEPSGRPGATFLPGGGFVPSDDPGFSIGGPGGIGDAVNDWLIPDFISWKNAIRIGEVIGGFLLVLLGLYLAGRRLGVSVPLPPPVQRVASAVDGRYRGPQPRKAYKSSEGISDRQLARHGKQLEADQDLPF